MKFSISAGQVFLIFSCGTADGQGKQIYQV